MPKTKNGKPRKFAPILIFVLIGLATMYFGLAYLNMHCLSPEQQQTTCEWYDIFCNVNNLISTPGQALGQIACLQQENTYRLILLGVGGAIAIIGMLKY